MPFLHTRLASGRWGNLSLAEQLGNIGSEVSRASKWQGKDEKLFLGAAWRALELFDITLQDERWKGRRKELGRAREVFCDTVFGKGEYKSSLKELVRYFDQFAFMARKI